MSAAGRFAGMVELAAAVDRGDDHATAAAAAALAACAGAGAVRETLRFLHLFRGFPRVVRAFNAAAPALASCADAAAGTGAPACPPAAAPGEELFRALYGADADRVLPHLRQLDPLLAAWILDHAYGRVIARDALPLPERERLAVLLLAADGCWKQWESHARICLRLGVPLATLAADLDRADWPSPAARAHAAAALDLLAGGGGA